MGATAQLAPNATQFVSENDSLNGDFGFWWKPDGLGGVTGNKSVSNQFYLLDDSRVDQTVHFAGHLLRHSLAPGDTARAFIGDCITDSFFLQRIEYVPLMAGQALGLALRQRRR